MGEATGRGRATIPQKAVPPEGSGWYNAKPQREGTLLDRKTNTIIMKKTIRENFRIIVEPRSLGDYGYVRTSDRLFYPDEEKRAKEYRNRCEDIEEQIKRHVDNVEYVRIECDEKVVCTYCGWGWEIDLETGQPSCCEEAIAEFEKLKEQE